MELLENLLINILSRNVPSRKNTNKSPELINIRKIDITIVKENSFFGSLINFFISLSNKVYLSLNPHS
jgi:hypothetical protein